MGQSWVGHTGHHCVPMKGVCVCGTYIEACVWVPAHMADVPEERQTHRTDRDEHIHTRVPTRKRITHAATNMSKHKPSCKPTGLCTHTYTGTVLNAHKHN